MRITLLLCILAPTMAIRGTSDLLMDMRPQVVAKLIDQVTNQWVLASMGVMSNTTDATHAYADMEKSCVKVSKSVISGSDGDEDRVSEYMTEVCNEPSASKMCTMFAKGMDDMMVGDANFNRNDLKLVKFCKSFWDTNVQSAARAKQDELAAQEKVAAEKKAADDKVAAEKKAEEEKAAAEKKAADDEAAAQKKVADEKAAAEKKAADDKASAERAEEEAKNKKEAEEKAAEMKTQQSEKLRGAIKAKTATLTAAIEKTATDMEQKNNSTEEDVHKLIEHAHTAMKVAAKKEADAVQKEKEAAAARVAAMQATAPANETMPAPRNVNISKANVNMTKTANKTA